MTSRSICNTHKGSSGTRQLKTPCLPSTGKELVVARTAQRDLDVFIFKKVEKLETGGI